MIYLSIGSNLGNRLQYLQRSIYLINQHIGNICALSSVWESPSWGFESHAFLNACVGLDTELSPEEILTQIHQIESHLGRVRNPKKNGYEARTIDIDLLFYHQQNFKHPSLTLPHPAIATRRFVLMPLSEIAPELQLHGKSISQHLTHCSDQSAITKIEKKLFFPKNTNFLFSNIRSLAIEGNIGVGKSTLAKLIAQKYNTKLVLEEFASNPFLANFYHNKNKYALPTELHFLADRYTQIQTFLANNEQTTVMDYAVFKSLIFAQVTLEGHELQLYKRLFSLLYKDIPKPDLYIFLKQSPLRLLQNIHKRARSYEQEISATYLEKLESSYLNFLTTQQGVKTLFIDAENLDFVFYEADFQYILQEIAHAVN